MPKNTTKTERNKPAKPHKDFPLFAHQNGQWAKKIRGSLRYFGSWSNPDDALNRYLDEKDDWLAGRVPQPKVVTLSVADLGERFLAAKDKRVRTAELSPRTFRDYHITAQRMADILGKDRDVMSLTPEDFSNLREQLSKRSRAGGLTSENVRSSVTLGNEIIRIKTMFRWAKTQHHIPHEIDTGADFCKPSRKTVRREKRLKAPKMFEGVELRTLLDAADTQLKAMILLAINAGYGNHDLSSLPLTALDLGTGWASHPRPKTEVDRRAPLWPETIKALKAAVKETDKIKASMEKRGHSNLEEVRGLVFVTKYGFPWVRANAKTWIDGIAQQFLKLRKEFDLDRQGLGFYSIRHTFSTIGNRALDPIAVNFLMGHVDDSVAANYREMIDDDRLQAVVNVVHKWLFSSQPKRRIKAK